MIVGYELEFRNTSGSSIKVLNAGSNFYLTSPSERATGTDVRVSF